MRELEIIATFDTPQTARLGTKLLNSWFLWIVEGANDDTEDIETLFEDFDLSFDDYSIDRDDVDWSEIPEAHLEGSRIVVRIVVGPDEKTGIDDIRALLDGMGAYEVTSYGEDD